MENRNRNKAEDPETLYKRNLLAQRHKSVIRFWGKYWKFDLIVNNLMDRLQEDFGLPEALSKIESSQNAEKEYDEYMKVFERIKQFMIQNESIEPECIENYGMIFQASDI